MAVTGPTLAEVGTAEGKRDIGRLIISCPDQHGILAALAGVLAGAGANIVASDQHSTDPEAGEFFLRVEFHLENFHKHRPILEQRIAAIAPRFRMTWQLAAADARKRVAVFVSRHEHCLLDLLWRWRTNDLEFDIVAVVSNHRDHEGEVHEFGVPYHHFPVSAETKSKVESAVLELLSDQVDLLVLARYMQILSARFLHDIAAPVINIHHSFLPAFPGKDPYVRAFERGVKLIGATAHYATEQLDEGPIIEQDVARVTHRAGPAELARIGRDIERVVLARAVRWHIEDRVIVYGNRTIVF